MQFKEVNTLKRKNFRNIMVAKKSDFILAVNWFQNQSWKQL
jgi:hypothetical protein